MPPSTKGLLFSVPPSWQAERWATAAPPAPAGWAPPAAPAGWPPLSLLCPLCLPSALGWRPLHLRPFQLAGTVCSPAAWCSASGEPPPAWAALARSLPPPDQSTRAPTAAARRLRRWLAGARRAAGMRWPQPGSWRPVSGGQGCLRVHMWRGEDVMVWPHFSSNGSAAQQTMGSWPATGWPAARLGFAVHRGSHI